MHPLNAALLAQGGGKYRCGKCQKVGNALDALFDQWPEAKDEGARQGDLPILGIALVPSLAQTPARADLKPGEAALPGESTDEADATEKPVDVWPRASWILGFLVLAVVIAITLSNYFGFSLFDRATVNRVLIESGLKEAPPAPLFRAPDEIEIISREMRTHPARPGVLLLTATVVNRASGRQAYPDIDVTLIDVRGQRLSRQLFQPGDYLKRTTELRTGMTPGAYLGLEIEILDPGEKAVGFELQFK